MHSYMEKLLPDYVSLYHIELNSGKYEILRLEGNTNARTLMGKKIQPFATYDDYVKKYADTFILKEEREEFLEWHACRNMKRRMRDRDKITYHYRSVSKEGRDSYYEAYAVKESVDEESFYILLGYRNIDSILYKEKAIQEQLQNALDEIKLGNEIISSIAKTYQYISRIDIQGDWFEEISNMDKKNLNFINSGVLSVNNKKVCREYVAEAYQEAFFRFTDITTLAQRMENEETIAMDYQMKDGNWHKMRFIEKKRDENGQLTHVLCAIRSISDSKKKEENLLYQVAEARKEAAVKSRFLSNMSHDIRTPMNGIIGMIDLANHYPEDMEMQKRCREKIMETSKYLVSMMNDILDMNKLESGDYVEENVPFDLAELLKQANTGRQMAAEEKGIEYVIDWDKSDFEHRHLIGNPAYLERLLTAIADNAVKFTNPGGRICVWCREISSDDERAVYEFVCSDNGVGMSEDFVKHAFDVFSQERESSRSKYEGVGLGLAIAKKITARLSGTIDIQSQQDIGTTIRMTIPFKIGSMNLVPKAEQQEEISLEGMRALIAEDNELNREIVQFMLEGNGISVDCAADGAEAVQKFEASAPGYYDMILMDIMMPNMNGWDAARKIRAMKRPDAEKIPMLAMSANAFAEDIVNSRLAGMNRHMAKPLDERKLLTELKACIINARSVKIQGESYE